MKVVSRVVKLDFTGCVLADEIHLTLNADATQIIPCAAYYMLLPASNVSALASIPLYANTTSTISVTSQMSYETVITMMMVKFTSITI
jgi:hypothetical protein